jgi:hypothetical protein
VTDGGNCDRTVLMPDEWGLPQWIPVGWLPSGGEIFIDLKPGPEARIAGPLRALKQVGDYLEVIKQPGANTVQCLWLDLYDGNLADDGVIPIGSALVSLRSTPTVSDVMGLPVAFYVYTSCSMYRGGAATRGHLRFSAILKHVFTTCDPQKKKKFFFAAKKSFL